MEPHFQGGGVTLYHGDCIEVLRTLPDESVDSVVTDPPYGLEFMGREWDSFGGDKRQIHRGEMAKVDNPFGRAGIRFGVAASYGGDSGGAMRAFQQWVTEWAAECLRVLKPGGHMLAFGGSRTWHRLAAGVEDAGFEIRDSIAWVYAQGFPKSLNVSKAIESHLTQGGSNSRALKRTELAGDGAPYTAVGKNNGIMGATVRTDRKTFDAQVPDAQAWEGFGTALKPAFEPVVVARKPLRGTVAANVLAYGTGALNIDATRVGTDERLNTDASNKDGSGWGMRQNGGVRAVVGRWPSNVVLDEVAASALDAQSGTTRSGKLEAHHARAPKEAGILGAYGSAQGERGYGDEGGVSRMFSVFRYEPKAPTVERPKAGEVAHPTVKPLALMEWLVRLVTPPGGTVLEPFAGSGTTAEACIREGFACIAIEREADYLPLIMQRLEKPHQQSLFSDLESA